MLKELQNNKKRDSRLISIDSKKVLKNRKKPILMNFLKPICGGCQTHSATGAKSDVAWDPD